MDTIDLMSVFHHPINPFLITLNSHSGDVVGWSIVNGQWSMVSGLVVM